MERYDAMIIGFGKGGKTLAGKLAQAGRKVALVERDAQRYGGTCINVACIPTKSLVESAALSAAMGGTFEERAQRYAEAIDQKNRLAAMLRDKNYHKAADNPNIDVIDGTASFVDAHHVAIAGADGEQTVEAEQVFINTGSQAFVPPIEGLEGNARVHTSDTMLEMHELPHRLVIIGGGYIGLEFASMFLDFGAQVTMVQDGDAFIPREDAQVAAAVLDSLEARGMELVRNASTQCVREGSAAAAVDVVVGGTERTFEAEAVLVATGRRPNIEGLNLEAAGVQTTERGAVKVDEHLRTTADNIWAMGDVAGGLQFTYVSLDDFRIVSGQLLGDGSRTTANRGAVPYSVFIDPPLSRVGLTEEEARKAGMKVRTFSLPAAAIPKAQVLRKPVGLLKAVVDEGTGHIVGAHLFCAESHELINQMKMAIDAELPYETLRDAIYTHPTMSEAFNDLFAG